jgi:hypothetical protein
LKTHRKYKRKENKVTSPSIKPKAPPFLLNYLHVIEVAKGTLTAQVFFEAIVGSLKEVFEKPFLNGSKIIWCDFKIENDRWF